MDAMLQWEWENVVSNLSRNVQKKNIISFCGLVKEQKRNVECLHIEGAKQSPEKRIRGFLSEYFFMAVLIRAAPPTGSCFSADSTL